MNDREHYAIVDLTFDSLEKRDVCCNTTLRKAARAMCMLPDQQAINLLRNKVPRRLRRLFPAKLPKFNFQYTQGDYRKLLPDNRFYLSSVLKAFKAKQFKMAGQLLGVYSHYLGDFSQPAHHYELEIGRLLPAPKQYSNCEYHRLLEDIPSSIATLGSYRPVPLGESIDELLFRLDSRFADLYRKSVASVIPMTRAIYGNRFDKASLILDGVVKETAELLADVLYTLTAISHRGFSRNDSKLLQSCDLRSLNPYKSDVEFNFSHRVLVDVIKLKDWDGARPFSLTSRKNGRTVSSEVKGICAIPHALPIPGYELRSMLEYRLPRKAFSRFQAVIGLLAGVDRQAGCRFLVESDGLLAYESETMKPGTPSQAVSVDITNVRQLRLSVRTDGSTDKLAFPIWAEPLLLK